jgi:hypothetical protein
MVKARSRRFVASLAGSWRSRSGDRFLLVRIPQNPQGDADYFELYL